MGIREHLVPKMHENLSGLFTLPHIVKASLLCFDTVFFDT